MKKIFAILDLAWGRTPMPSIWGSTNTNFDYVLRTVGRTPMPEWSGRRRNLFIPLMIYILWPLRAPVLIWQYTYKYGSAAKKDGAPSVLKQITDQLKLSLFTRVSPEQYYCYRLFEPGAMIHAKQFLLPNVSSSLFRLINESDDELIEDKFEVCKKLSSCNIPTTQTHIVAKNGVIVFQDPNYPYLIKEDIIIKPNDGGQGQGLHFIEYVGKDKYRIDEKILSSSEVIEHFKKLSDKHTYLLQPCLKNHSLISPLAPKSVSTIRLITALLPNGDVEKIYAVLKIPSIDQVADNFATGGLSAAIEIDTGRVGKARTKRMLAKSHSVDPNSGNKIEGLILPYWKETVDIGLKAHKLYPTYVFLGWDIAITDNGPVILEANSIWCTRLMQTPELYPLGSTILADIAKEWIINKRRNKIKTV